jgi:hypothetical protein
MPLDVELPADPLLDPELDPLPELAAPLEPAEVDEAPASVVDPLVIELLLDPAYAFEAPPLLLDPAYAFEPLESPPLLLDPLYAVEPLDAPPFELPVAAPPGLDDPPSHEKARIDPKVRAAIDVTLRCMIKSVLRKIRKRPHHATQGRIGHRRRHGASL